MDEELLKLVTSLPNVQGYSPQQRYQDFRQLFGTDQGQRVLAEIVSWGKLFRTPSLGNPVDPAKAVLVLGEANIAKRLLFTYNFEPPEQTGKQEKS